MNFFFILSLFFCYGKKWIGRDIEQAFIETIIGPIDDRQQYFYPHNFICLPCEPGCRDCDDDQPCFIKFDQTFRIIVLIIQLFCIIIAILIALLTFRLRYTKVCVVIDRIIWLNLIINEFFILFIFLSGFFLIGSTHTHKQTGKKFFIPLIIINLHFNQRELLALAG